MPPPRVAQGTVGGLRFLAPPISFALEDANAPKKPAGGAYGVFVSENRAAIQATLPAGSGVPAIGKEAGRQWKAGVCGASEGGLD